SHRWSRRPRRCDVSGRPPPAREAAARARRAAVTPRSGPGSRRPPPPRVPSCRRPHRPSGLSTEPNCMKAHPHGYHCSTMSKPLALLLVAVVLKGLMWVVTIPPFDGPDEPDHFAYSQMIAVTGQLPGPSHG